MTWEDDLRATSAELGRRLESAHWNPPRRTRVRGRTAVALALVLGGVAVLAWPAPDPGAAIEAQYASQITEVRIDDAEVRREFDAALEQVNRAIALAKDALRRSPKNPAFAELCHVAYRAKVRLIQAYSLGG
jgi:hypothetical protein